MRKVILAVALLTLGIAFSSNIPLDGLEARWASCPEGVKLALWNLRDFSDRHSDDEVGNISQILFQFDFIAVVELLDFTIIDRTIEELKDLGREFDAIVSPRSGNSPQSAERIGFLYDTKKLAFVGNASLSEDARFDRQPFYVSFRAEAFDFTVIAHHVCYTCGGETSAESRANRRAEITALTDLFKQVQSADPNEQDVVLMADFNLEPRDSAFGALRALGADPLFDCSTHAECVKDATTISDSALYDNMWFQSQYPLSEPYVSEYTGEKGIDRFDERLFGNIDELVDFEVSDHRPIWARFETCVDDD